MPTSSVAITVAFPWTISSLVLPVYARIWAKKTLWRRISFLEKSKPIIPIDTERIAHGQETIDRSSKVNAHKLQTHVVYRRIVKTSICIIYSRRALI